MNIKKDERIWYYMTDLSELIKYIPLIQEVESFEEPVHEGTSGFVHKSNLVLSFTDDFYSFVNDNKEYDLTNYDEILEQ